MWLAILATVTILSTMAMTCLVMVKTTQALVTSVSTAFQKVLSPGEIKMAAGPETAMTTDMEVEDTTMPWDNWGPQVLNPNTEEPTSS